MAIDMIDITRDEAKALMAAGGRLRFLHSTEPGASGGFVVHNADRYPGEPHYIADVREGFAQGVYEPICELGHDYVFDSYLETAAVWIDRGEWVRVRIEGTTGGPDELIDTH
jgi:hypothetical protein